MKRRLPARLLASLGVSLCLLWIGVAAQAPQGQAQAPAGQPRVAQAPQPAPPLPAPINVSDDPLLKPFRFRSIGPASMGGRIDDIAVVESDPSVMYVGFATGGLWKTINNGTTWTPIFDIYPVCSIGSVAVDQRNPNIVWVGTGEPNNRQSSSFGDGVYKSTDSGKTFTHVGLKETQTIARVVIDPRDSNIVYVAAVGHLFGPNPERGIYKTIDGGKTWNAVKTIDADTGFTDLVIDRANPNVLYAASYQRRRQPWGFNGGGPGSGLWKTTDAGKTWTKIEGNGLPEGLLGRIGLSVSLSKPHVVYAQIEVGASAGTGGNVTADGKPVEPGAGFGGGRGGAQPSAPPDPKRSGVWRSDDAGKTWRLMSNNNDRPMYYSQIRVDPTNPEIVYTMGAPFHKSVDGGKTFRVVQGIAHSDHHAMWINPRNPKQLVLGNDGGLDVSYDQGDTWEFVNTIAVGQFYAISADMRKPYYVYGGLQDNGTWGGPSATRNALGGITNADWFRVGGGDGFYTQVDPTDFNVIYVESQDGNVQRLDLRLGRSVQIRPRAPQRPRQGQQGEQGAALAAMAAQVGMGAQARPNVQPPLPEGEPIRFFWNTPLLLSPHNPRLLYVGANRLFKSYDRGDTYLYTPDLTKNISRFERPIMGVAGDAPMASKHDGAGAFSSVITVSESPIVPGVIWAGTNDGNVQVSRDGGATWKNVVDNVQGVPKETHVSRVEASHFDAATCYVSFDGHRTNDHKPYVFITKDYGATWKPLANNLPAGNVNVVKEDPKNPNLLVPRHRVWPVHLAQRRRRVEALHERHAERANRRPHGAPARQRSDRRDARPQHLDPRRHHGAAAAQREGHRRRGAPVRRPAGRELPERRHAQSGGWRPEALPRREPAARHGHQLLPQVGRRRRREDHDLRRDRPRSAKPDRHEGSGAESRAVEPPARSAGSPSQPARWSDGRAGWGRRRLRRRAVRPAGRTRVLPRQALGRRQGLHEPRGRRRRHVRQVGQGVLASSQAGSAKRAGAFSRCRAPSEWGPRKGRARSVRRCQMTWKMSFAAGPRAFPYIPHPHRWRPSCTTAVGCLQSIPMACRWIQRS